MLIKNDISTINNYKNDNDIDSDIDENDYMIEIDYETYLNINIKSIILHLKILSFND